LWGQRPAGTKLGTPTRGYRKWFGLAFGLLPLILLVILSLFISLGSHSTSLAGRLVAWFMAAVVAAGGVFTFVKAAQYALLQKEHEETSWKKQAKEFNDAKTRFQKTAHEQLENAASFFDFIAPGPASS
jgi:hypothetical protein